MRIRSSKDPGTSTGGEGSSRGQLHSRRASLIKEFCLDAKGNETTHPEAAEEFVLQTLIPCDFARAKAP